MFRKIFILISLFVYCQGEDPVFRYDYKYFERANGWLKLSRFPINWRNAKRQCFLEGAVLVSPLNVPLLESINKLIQEQKTSPEVIYSGVNSLFSPGTHTSIEGVPLERLLVNWSPNEPRYVLESCLVFFANGTMGNRDCNDELPFICYKKNIDVVINECGTVDNEYHLIGRTCFKYHSQVARWSRAYAICQAEGAHLAKLNNTDEWLGRKMGSRIISIGFQLSNDIWWDIHGNARTPQRQINGDSDVKCGGLSYSGIFIERTCYEEDPFVCEKAVDSLLTNSEEKQ